MAGIVKSTNKRIVVNKKIREIVTPTATLDTDLYYSDLVALGAVNSNTTITAELNRLPVLVKNEAVLSLVANTRRVGNLLPFNGDTKTVEILSFTRGSSATYNHPSGVILTPPDMARQDYDPNTSALNGFLFEPASTNLLLYSGMGNYGSFQLFYGQDVPRCSLATEVGRSCVKVSEGGSLRFASIAIIPSTIYTYSFWIKSNTPFTMVFSNYNGASYNPESISVSSNWQRVTKTFLSKSDATFDIVHLRNNSGANLPELFITDIQLESGSFASSYIPTTNAAASRLSDKLVGNRPISVFPFNSWYMESDLYTGWFGNGVNGLKIVGRNYIKNSALFYPLSSNNTATFAQTAGIENGVRWVGGTEKATGKFALSTYSVTAYGPEVTENLVNATDIVASIDIMATANITVRFGTKMVTMVAGVWQRVFDTGLTIDRVPSLYAISNPEAPVDTKIYYKNYKLERGTVATSWSPAPEDFVKIAGNGTVEVSSDIPVCIRSLSLVARQLKQSEV